MEDHYGPPGGRGANGETSKGEGTDRNPLALFLLLCLKQGYSYGYRLEERLTEEPGFDGIRPGEMYHVLWRMERDGLVLCDREGGGYRLPQRRFELTGPGEACLESLVYSRAHPEEERELFFRVV